MPPKINDRTKVLELLMLGKTTREIALVMNSSSESVQQLIEREYRKRGLCNRHQLILALHGKEVS